MENHELETALEIIRERRHIDFGGYKRPLLRRRLEQRARMRRFTTVAGYLKALAMDPGEIDTLVSALRLKITQFFRDPDTWEVIETRVLPEIIARRSRQRMIKAWSAGCSTGQEGYSLAMAIAEALESAHRDWPFLVAATNIDPVALARAREGVYPPDRIEGLSAARVARWMERCADGNLRIRDELRGHVTFGVHDLLAGDRTFRDIDLVLCRNVIMFFEPNAKRNALAHLRDSLAPDGFLVLGSGEFVPSVLGDFSVVDRVHHIYRADHLGINGPPGPSTPPPA